MSSPEGSEQRKWHVGREIPVAVLVGLALQTVAFIVWITMLAARVEMQGSKLGELVGQVNAISNSVAASNTPLVVNTVEVAALKAQINELRTRLEAIQSERRNYR